MDHFIKANSFEIDAVPDRHREIVAEAGTSLGEELRVVRLCLLLIVDR